MIVRFVFDSSAVVAYAHGSANVGELVSELSDEADELSIDLGFTVPSVCLVAAAGDAPKVLDAIRLLASHSRCQIGQSDINRWMSANARLSDLELSAVATEVFDAIDANADQLADDQVYVVTAAPERYLNPVLDGLDLIDVR